MVDVGSGCTTAVTAKASVAGSAVPGGETRALFVTRRWLVTVLSLNLALVASLAGRYRWPDLSVAEQVLLIASIALIVVGVGFGRTVRGLWLVVGGMACLPLAAVVAPTGSPVWLPMPNSVSNVFYVAILLASIRVGLGLAVAGPALLALIWARHPTNIVGGVLELAGGWVVVAQILASSLMLWWAWHLLLREATRTDQAMDGRRARTSLSVEVQIRERLWRATATSLHESVLNTIRYVLGAGPLDRERLKVELQTPMPELIPAPAQEFSLQDLAVAIDRDRVIVRPGRRSGVLDAQVFQACRAAVAELITNALVHGKATVVEVSFDATGDGRLVITVTDDGEGFTPGWIPGIGTRTVLDLSLGDVDGTWRVIQGQESGVTATIVVPVRSAVDRDHDAGATGVFDRGRLLATAVFAGACVVGPIYSLWILTGYGVRGMLAAVAVCVGCAVAATTACRRVRLGYGGLVIVLPMLLPWLLLKGDFECTAAPEVSGVLNISGFAVAVIALWWRPVWGFLGLAVWAVGGFALVVHFPATCRDSVGVSLLNSMMLFPLLVLVTFIGIRVFVRARAKDDDVRYQDIVERSHTAAVVDLNSSLDRSVREAMNLLDEIASGAEVDEAMRASLELADGRIRVAIQADPQGSGCFVLAARRLVMYAASVGVPMHVRALASSGDRRPLPIEVEVLLRRLVAEQLPAPASVQAFTDGRQDHLSITTITAAVELVALHPGESRRIDDIVIEVGVPAGSGSSPVMVLLSRVIDVSHEGATL